MPVNRKGFTIIELMLAMALLGTMMVAIASLIMRILDVYQKGLTMRDVSTIGREITSDLTRIINQSPTFFGDDKPTINPIVTAGGNIDAASIRKYRTEYYNTASGGGVFCTGSYSYVWNKAASITTARNRANSKVGGDVMMHSDEIDATIANDLRSKGVFIIQGTDGYIVPRLVRFADRNREACAHQANDTSNGTALLAESGGIKKSTTHFDLSSKGMSTDDFVELIGNSKTDVAVYHFEVAPATQNESTGQIFYSGMFIIATIRGGVKINSNGNYCTGEAQDGSEYIGYGFSYCAVNKFNFSARATGESAIYRNGD